MVFPVVMNGCESWIIKKAECQRIDAFELWYWKRFLRVPWTARRSNQSILKEISPGYSLEGLMLKLKLQCFGHLMQRTDSFEKTLMLGKIEGKKRRGQQRMRCLNGITARWTWVWVNSGSWWWTGRPGMLQSMGPQSVRHDWVTELNWMWVFSHCGIVVFFLLLLSSLWWKKHLIAAFLCLWTGGVFFGGFQHLPFDGCSTACCALGVLAGRDEQTSFYSTVLPSLLTAPPHLVSS